MTHPIILYDGVCGLCNRLNQFVLRRDPDGIFRFASLQSGPAARILARHGANPGDLNTVYVVLDHDLPGEHLLLRSDAIAFILRQLGGLWKPLGLLGQLIPRPLSDWAYGMVARNRYRVFGRSESCMLPSPQHRDRFLDD
jgi:predicted DCC family thiol-disulfide oxidoreductase YuxK